MGGFLNILGDWHFWALASSFYLFMAFVSGMPEPMPNGSPGYLWLYRSLHAFSANVSALVGKKFGGQSTVSPSPGNGNVNGER